jgi:ATP/maltotriose-dependent transcriptional regulator MalT
LAQVSERLVGRADELGQIDDALGALDQGRPALIELVGEPGIGKTRLLAELAELADRRGHIVLSGCAAELERDLPFWVFVDALDEYVRGLDPRLLASLDDDVRTELASVLPSLSAPGDQAAALHDERYRAHRAVCELLERLSSQKGVVLVLDDLHWADSASVELLGALLRRPPDAPVLMALADRPRQVPERLAVALQRAQRAGILERIELGALTRSEAGELLDRELGDAAASALYDDSGGNPFYLQQLAWSLRRGQMEVTAAPSLLARSTGFDVPRTVAVALTEELGLLSSGARRLLEGAAVAGDPFDPELASAAAAASADDAAEALDELLRLDLVRPTDVPRRFRFRHPLVRRAVYETSPGAWRLDAHERASRALDARGASAAARAHHVEQSGRLGDRSAIATLREAGEATVQRAPGTAARWLGGALRLLPDNAPAEERVDLLVAQANALAATGRFGESHAALVESIGLLPPESVAREVRLTTMCANVEHLLGHHEEAHTRLVNALERLPGNASPEAVALMVELAMDGFYRTRGESMLGWAARAVDAARPLTDPALTAAAVALLALAHAWNGNIAEADIHRAEAATLVDALPDTELARRLDAASNLANVELSLDRYAESRLHAERAVAVARATAQGAMFPSLFIVLASIATAEARFADAAEILAGAVESARLAGDAQGLAWMLLNRGLLATTGKGDVEMGLAAAEECCELTRDLDRSYITDWSTVVLARALMQAGEARRAREVLEDAAGNGFELIPCGWRVGCFELLTRCLLALDRPEEAQAAAVAAATHAARLGLPFATAMADRAAAEVALHLGDALLAAERALASAEQLERLGTPVEVALSRMLAGRAFVLSGDRERSTTELAWAAATCEERGSHLHFAEAERELRRLGYRRQRAKQTRGTDSAGISSLSGRELEVARLVVDRKTNPEIAAELFLSLKTVETHMRHIFRKLDVSSRIEVARLLERSER